MVYERRYVPGLPQIVPPAVPAPAAMPRTAAYLVELKRFSTLLETMTLAAAIAKMAEETGSDAWWDMGIVEYSETGWRPYFDNILGADPAPDFEAEANKWIWEMWFLNEIAAVEAFLKGSETSESSDSITKMLADLKTFRALLDHMTLAESIAAFEELIDSDDWWSNQIIEGGQDAWSDLFDRILGDWEDVEWDEMDEKNKWVWKKYFDDMIKHLEHPGEPPEVITPEVEDKLEKKINDVQADLDERVPEPGTPVAAEDPPAAWPDPIPEKPVVPGEPDPLNLAGALENLRLIHTYLTNQQAWHTSVLFNMCWGIEQARACLNTLRIAKAPGTQEEGFEANLSRLSDTMHELETKGVFYD